MYTKCMIHPFTLDSLDYDTLDRILHYSSCYQAINLYITSKRFGLVLHSVSKKIPIRTLVTLRALNCIKSLLINNKTQQMIDNLYDVSLSYDSVEVLNLLIDLQSWPSGLVLDRLPQFITKYMDSYNYFSCSLKTSYKLRLVEYVTGIIEHYADTRESFLDLVDSLIYLDKFQLLEQLLNQYKLLKSRSSFSHLPRFKTLLSIVVFKSVFWGRINILKLVSSQYPTEFAFRIFYSLFHFILSRRTNKPTLDYIRDKKIINRFTSRQKRLLKYALFYNDLLTGSKLFPIFIGKNNLRLEIIMSNYYLSKYPENYLFDLTTRWDYSLMFAEHCTVRCLIRDLELSLLNDRQRRYKWLNRIPVVSELVSELVSDSLCSIINHKSAIPYYVSNYDLTHFRSTRKGPDYLFIRYADILTKKDVTILFNRNCSLEDYKEYLTHLVD